MNKEFKEFKNWVNQMRYYERQHAILINKLKVIDLSLLGYKGINYDTISTDGGNKTTTFLVAELLDDKNLLITKITRLASLLIPYYEYLKKLSKQQLNLFDLTFTSCLSLNDISLTLDISVKEIKENIDEIIYKK